MTGWMLDRPRLAALILAALTPDVPTVAEYGIAGFDDATWFAFFVPSRTPPAVLERLNAEINRILDSPDTRAKLAGLGLDVRVVSYGKTPQSLEALAARHGTR